MTDLILRLSAVAGPSRELDAEIALSIGWLKSRYGLWINGVELHDGPPRYTASIDAALTLVPEGAVWHVMTDYGDLKRAKVGPPGLPSASVYSVEDRPLFVEADASTPAIALVIACLKAKEDRDACC